MLMRCLDDLIRHVVIGWQVSEIDVKSRGVRRRRRNYFMGAARTRRGAPRGALKTLLLRAVITLWGRRARAMVCRLHHYHTYSIQLQKTWRCVARSVFSDVFAAI